MSSINIIEYDAAYALKTVQMWRASMEAALGIKDTHSWEEQLDYLQSIAAQHQLYLALDTATDQVVGMMAVGGSELDQLYIRPYSDLIFHSCRRQYANHVLPVVKIKSE